MSKVTVGIFWKADQPHGWALRVEYTKKEWAGLVDSVEPQREKATWRRPGATVDEYYANIKNCFDTQKQTIKDCMHLHGADHLHVLWMLTLVKHNQITEDAFNGMVVQVDD